MTRTALLICPGRGTYTKTELGYLARHHADKRPLLDHFDAMRAALGQDTLTALDTAPSYSVARHTRGDNASALIYAATLADFQSINRDDIEIVAVTGNSMGWYSALACGGALTPENGFQVVNTMGTLMQQKLIGGQTVYPFLGEDWAANPAKQAELLTLIAQINTRKDHTLALSIALGGMLVIAGNDAGLTAFEAAVPPLNRFPMRLANHAAFHTALQAPVAEAGRAALPQSLFQQPTLPLIDGRGAIWWPGATDPAKLRDYTLGHQVTQAYDFTHAIRTGLREFAPDIVIVTGPGTTLGGAVAQSMVLANWQGLATKEDFQTMQANTPRLVAMGMDDQRLSVTAKG